MTIWGLRRRTALGGDGQETLALEDIAETRAFAGGLGRWFLRRF